MSVPKLLALALVALVLVMARVNSSASAQSVCLQDDDPFSCYGAESRFDQSRLLSDNAF